MNAELVHAKTFVNDLFVLIKFRIGLMVVFSTSVGYVLGMGYVPDPIHIFHVLFATFLTTSGTGVLNQFMERERDARMGRTADRPGPRDAAGPGRSAVDRYMRSGGSQQFQHIVNMPRARIQHTRYLAITPGLNDSGDLGQGQRMREGPAIGADSSECEHHGVTQPHRHCAVEATRPPLPGNVVKGARRIDGIQEQVRVGHDHSDAVRSLKRRDRSRKASTSMSSPNAPRCAGS